MAGETPKHNRIALNFSTCFDIAFSNRDCEVYVENIRLRVSPDQYRYPDVMAICGQPQFDGGRSPCLLNPGVIIEVASPSTQATDRGEKFLEYQQMPSLTDYVMVAQESVLVTHCVRQSAAQWTIAQYTQLDSVLTFASLGVTMSLREMHRKTPLADTENPAAVPPEA